MTQLDTDARRFRLPLWTVLVAVVALTVVVFGFVVERRRQARNRAVEYVRRLGGEVVMDNSCPEWLQAYIGGTTAQEYFDWVLEVHVRNVKPVGADVRFLAALRTSSNSRPVRLRCEFGSRAGQSAAQPGTGGDSSWTVRRSSGPGTTPQT